nr:nucleoporin NUP188 homolog [Onthophagus taurus]
MSTTICWKKVWLTLAGDIQGVTVVEAENVLKLSKNKLLEGLGQYKPYKEGTLDLIPVIAAKIKEKGGQLEKFVEQFNIHLNLQCDIGWKVFCNFLIFEYYGKVEDIQKIAEYELYNLNLFKQLWLFYSSERMYMIKTMKHILENSNNQKHGFYKLYANFLNEMDIVKIRDSLFDQYQLLTNEIKRDNEQCCLDFKDWVTRNHREQIETLHCIMITMSYKPCNIDEFILLIDVCKKHAFAYMPSNDGILTVCEPEELKHIRMIQLAAMLLAAKTFWEDSAGFQRHTEAIGNNIFQMSNTKELSILLTLYISLQLATGNKEFINKNSNLYTRFIMFALEQKVYYYLNELISLSDWNNTFIGEIMKQTIFYFVEYTSYNFDDCSTVLIADGMDDLISKLAENRDFAISMMTSDSVYKKFYVSTYQMMPHTFVPFTKVSTQLLKHKELYDFVYEMLNDVKTFAEIYNETPYDGQIVLRQDYQPRGVKSLTIPTGTRAVIRKINTNVYIIFDYAYKYIDVLEYMASLVVSDTDMAKENMHCVELGYKCLIPILQKDLGIKFYGGLNYLQPVLLRTSTRPIINIDLIVTCLDICTLLLNHEPEKITDFLVINNFLPHAMKDLTVIEKFFENSFLNTCMLLHTIREEIGLGKVNVLFSYINFLKKLIELKKCVHKVLIPGMVFLFVHIFPIHLNWLYETNLHKQQLSNECLGVILSVLQNNYQDLNGDDKTIYDFCFCLITDHSPTIELINKLFRMTNSFLNAYIMTKGDWERRSSISLVQCLKKVLAIINIILLLHNRGERNLKGTIFLEMFLDSTVKPSSLKLLTGYMQQSFDLAIPKLSCQILKKLAINSDIPMLSLLEMDKYQLQCTFLEKLRDPLEEESLKVAILDLITLCVQNQSGMIVAFFDISGLPHTNCVDIGDSVNAFMEEYLENIRKSTDYLYSPIQAAVLDLFHALWMYRKNMIVDDLTKNENFWSTLMDPLFKDLKLPIKTYTKIISILTYELFRSKGSNEKIIEVIKKLFSTEEKHLKAWCNFIIKSLEDITNLELLRTWKHLLIAICKNYSQTIADNKQQKLLVEACLDGIMEHFSQNNDIRVFSVWSEIYLSLITQYPNSSKGITSKVLETFTKLFKYLEDIYTEKTNHLNEVILSISIKTVPHLDDISTETLTIEQFLRAVGKVFEKEHEKIKRHEEGSTYSNWLLLITFGTYLLQCETKVCLEWFKETQFLTKILHSIAPFIQNSIYFPIGKITVQCLIAYANSPLVEHFMYVNFEPFFDSTRPSERYIHSTELSYKNALPWHFENWWLTYTGIIQLMTMLLNKFGRLMLTKLMSFALVHCDVIKYTLRLPLVTSEITAIRLVRECLRFTYALLDYKVQWRLIFPQIYFTYLQAIIESINASTAIILRPTVLKFFAIEKSTQLSFVDHLPTNSVIQIMNGLLEVITYSCLCLTRACPTFVNLLEPYKIPFPDDVQVAYHFHIPKIHDENVNVLKYGSLLCLLHILCKTSSGSKSQSNSTTDLNASDLTSSPTKSDYLSFVCPDYFGRSISDKYTTLQPFASSEHTFSTKWLTGLQPDRVHFALETLTTFLAKQIYLTTHFRRLTPAELYHVKRELCSELLYFQEYTRKKNADQQQYKTIDNFVFRKFYAGEALPYLSIGEVQRYAKVSIYQQFEECEISPRYGDFLDCDIDDDRVFYEANCFKSLIPSKKSMEKRKSPKVTTRYHGIRGNEKVLVENVYLGYSRDNLPINPADYLLLLSHWFFHVCQLSH